MCYAFYKRVLLFTKIRVTKMLISITKVLNQLIVIILTRLQA